MREPKESPWKLSEPANFRFWVKKNTTPLGYDKALKKKNSLATAYFFCSLITLNLILYDVYKRRQNAYTVAPENETLQTYLATTPIIKPDENVNAYMYSFENFKFKSAEHVDLKEMEKRRLE